MLKVEALVMLSKGVWGPLLHLLLRLECARMRVMDGDAAAGMWGSDRCCQQLLCIGSMA